MSTSVPASGRWPEERLRVTFVNLVLPRIECCGRFHFRHLKSSEHRDEAIAEMIGLGWKWYVDLTRRGKDVTGFVSALATFAARAVKSGRRLCGQERSRDVLSPLAQKRQGFTVHALPVATTTSYEHLYGRPRGQSDLDVFEELLRDNTITPVLDQVQFRLDFPAWLQTLSGRDRRLVGAMIRNERTQDLSRRFGVSAARISQLRRAFQQDWNRFCGDFLSEASFGAQT
jgi:hypothetical protein